MSTPRLNRLLTLEQRSRLPDGAGGFVEAWEILGQIWAEVGSRGTRRAGDRSQAHLKITLRAIPFDALLRPRPDHRFREGERIYRIEAVTEQDTAARYLVCLAREEVAR